MIISVVTNITLSFLEVFFSKKAEKRRELTVSVKRFWRFDRAIAKDVIDIFREALGVQSGDFLPLDSSFTSFCLSNTGRLPIKVGDFDRTFRVSFGISAEILLFRVKDVSPVALESTIVIHQEQSQLIVDPLLLNPKEEFTVEVLGFNFESVNPVGRFVGMSEIRAEEKQRIWRSILQSNRNAAVITLKFGLALLVIIVLLVAFTLNLFSIDALNSTADHALDQLCFLFFRSNDFRRGFLTSLVIAYLLSTLTRYLLYAIAQLKKFNEAQLAGQVFKYSDK